MPMNLKLNKHKRISFNTTSMASLGFIGTLKFSSPLPPQIYFFAQVPPNYFGVKFLGPPPLKLGGAATMDNPDDSELLNRWKIFLPRLIIRLHIQVFVNLLNTLHVLILGEPIY